MKELERFTIMRQYWVAKFYRLADSGMVRIFMRCKGKREDWISENPFVVLESSFADVLNNAYLDLRKNAYSINEIKEIYGRGY